MSKIITKVDVMENRTDNNSLYFIVGGLVVAALLFGFIYMANNSDGVQNITPASGEYMAPYDTTVDENKTEIIIRDNDDGSVSGTVTERDTDRTN